MCGIFGVFGHPDAARFTYLGLYALQHRGQESAGIVSSDGKRLYREGGMGLVADVFDSPAIFDKLPGTAATGQVRYSTCGASVASNIQPLMLHSRFGPLAVAHNGNIPNAEVIRDGLLARGVNFTSSTDTESILHLLSRADALSMLDAIKEAFLKLRGAYALLIQTTDRVYLARDIYGFRPLVLGRFASSGGYAFGSETCAFDLVGADYLREIAAGEIVELRSGEEPRSVFLTPAQIGARCVFEHEYFARPDSMVFGLSVGQMRYAFGRQLAREAPAAADVVVPVPDSGIKAALGYAAESGIPFDFGLIRNHYVGRTFIEPRDAIRHFGVRVKLNADRSVIGGRRVALIDDSIVRCTTGPKIVLMAREAGAREVHVRISSPPFVSRCHYGIDTPTDGELIASAKSVEEIRQALGADSLQYLSLEGMHAVVSEGGAGWCDACFTRNYPVPVT